MLMLGRRLVGYCSCCPALPGPQSILYSQPSGSVTSKSSGPLSHFHGEDLPAQAIQRTSPIAVTGNAFQGAHEDVLRLSVVRRPAQSASHGRKTNVRIDQS